MAKRKEALELKKLIRVGNSTAVLLDANQLDELGWQRGDVVRGAVVAGRRPHLVFKKVKSNGD